MELNKVFKKMMIDKEVKQIDLADSLGLSKENFHAQLRRNNFRITDIIKIADILNYDVNLQFIDRDTNRIIDVEHTPTTPELIPPSPAPTLPAKQSRRNTPRNTPIPENAGEDTDATDTEDE
jgi:DNA-binding Xre family transcriptional regulator